MTNADSVHPKAAAKRERRPAVEVTVSWGYDVAVTLVLTPRNWSRVRRGHALKIRGKGYEYEGEFFWDYWTFQGGLQGELRVEYGEDGGEGFRGLLSEATIREQL